MKRFLSLSFLNSITVYLVVIAGILLSGLQFFYNRSLWGDEAMLAINFVERDFVGLLEPLSFSQTAPLLYLWIEELFSLLIPNSEMGLRIFPLICFWGCIYYFFKINKLVFKNLGLVVTSMSLLVFNFFLIYYSSEVKQYMVDVFFSCFFIYQLVNKNINFDKKILLLFISGAISLLITNIAPILLFTTTIYICVDKSINSKNIRKLFWVSVGWALVLLCYYLLFVSKIKAQDFLINYWTNKEPAFMPLNPFSAEFWNFMYAKYIMLFYYLFRFGKIAAISFQILMILGIYRLFKTKNWQLLVIIFIPLIVHLLLSALKIYPFHIRFCLYLIPGFILLIVKGVELLHEMISHRFERFNFPLPLIPFLALMLFLNFKLNGFPLVKQEYKKTLKYVTNKIKPNDKVFIFQESEVIFRYYKLTGNVTIPDSHFIYGKYFKDESIDSQFKKITGPVWLLITGVEEENQVEVNNYFLQHSYILTEEYAPVGATVKYYTPIIKR